MSKRTAVRQPTKSPRRKVIFTLFSLVAASFVLRGDRPKAPRSQDCLGKKDAHRPDMF